jgi:proton glutamate symport protein
MVPLGEIFLLLLKMCVYPVLVTSVVCSFGRLTRSGARRSEIGRILIVFLSSFVLITAVSLYGAIIMGPGKNISQNEQEILGRVLLDSSDSDSQFGVHESRGIYGLVKSIIPANIFEALGKGENIQILFFSSLFGIAAGLSNKKIGDPILELSESAFQLFLDMMNWAMLILPFGLFFLLAGQIASTGFTILLSMMDYIGYICGLSIFIILLNGVIISIKEKKNFFSTFGLMKDPLLVSFGTRSTFASIPVSIQSLIKKMKISSEVVNLVIPLGSVLARFSMMMIYASAAVFAAQLYKIDLSHLQLIEIIFYSIVVAIAGAGTPAAASLSMISIILTPFALPSTSIVVLLMAVMPIIDPIVTMANVHTNCTLAILIDNRGKK